MADHGTYARYTKGKCRCDECRAANARCQREGRKARRERTTRGGVPDGITHGASAYTNWGCRCAVCKEAHTAACEPHVKKWVEGNRDTVRASRRRQHYRSQSLTLPKAERRYQVWTGPELEIASRTDLSAREVALMIGRTAAAVATMRKRLRSDPKTINLAGLATPPSGPSSDA